MIGRKEIEAALAEGECPDWGPFVACDKPCWALQEPRTLEEYKATLEHYKRHSFLGGCSHGS